MCITLRLFRTGWFIGIHPERDYQWGIETWHYDGDRNWDLHLGRFVIWVGHYPVRKLA